MPPNVGVAIGLVMSMPEPVANMIGRRESVVAATVISFGRSRETEPSTTASMYDSFAALRASASRMNSIMMMPVWIATANSDDVADDDRRRHRDSPSTTGGARRRRARTAPTA